MELSAGNGIYTSRIKWKAVPKTSSTKPSVVMWITGTTVPKTSCVPRLVMNSGYRTIFCQKYFRFHPIRHLEYFQPVTLLTAPIGLTRERETGLQAPIIPTLFLNG